ncbi:MAG: amino acid adenylation domain-containing protein, partial [Ruminiclostridium sp.]
IGMFVNTVPIEIQIEDDGVENNLKRNRTNIIGVIRHQRYNYGLISNELKINKLYDIIVNYQIALEDLNDGEKTFWFNPGAQAEGLAINIIDSSEASIKIMYDYQLCKYDGWEISELHKHIMNIVNNGIINGNEIGIVCKEEFVRILKKFNDTEAEFPKDKTIVDLLEEQVEKTPINVAAVFENERITYEELNARANALAHRLRGMGVKPNEFVAIYTKRSLEMVIGIYAIIKAGGAYVPINTFYPYDRIQHILHDSQPKALLVYGDTIETEIPLIDLADSKVWSGETENLKKVNSPFDSLYVIYTSGTTGTSKGVVVSHRNVVRLLFNDRCKYDFCDKDSWTMFHSYGFDFSVWEMYGANLFGGKLVIVSDECRHENEKLLKLLADEHVTVLNQVPSAFYQLMSSDYEGSMPELRYLIFGGEALNPGRLQVWHKNHPNVKIVNMYGITETTVHVTYREIEDAEIECGISDIGTAIPTLAVYIMNGMNMCGIGIAGEICVAGEGVSKGYLNRPELTAVKFIDNPFGEGKMYRSGDLARWLPNGNIEYLGRIDEQVKINGFRIELGEIDSKIRETSNIKDCAVITRPDKNGDMVICAYYVSEHEVSTTLIRDVLAQSLPVYMIPTYMMQIDAIPITGNGKLDKSVLPEIEIHSEREYVAPETELEKKVCKIFSDILNLKNTGMNDNYYQLGGDSIKAIQISSRMANEGMSIKVKDILAYDTIREIADSVALSDKKTEISQEKASGSIPDTSMVKWFLEQKLSKESRYNQYVIVEYNDELNYSVIKKALTAIIDHHDTLRINLDEDRHLFYNDHLRGEMINIEEIDLKRLSYNDQYAYIKEYYEIHQFNLNAGLLFYAALFDLDDNKQALLFVAHHLIIDGISWRIILEDFFKVIHQIKSSEEITLPQKTHSFQKWGKDMVEYAEKRFGEQIDYWKDIDNRYDNYLRDLIVSGEKGIGITDIKIESKMVKQLTKKVGEIYNTDLNEILIIALVITLHKLTGTSNILIELERHGREAINDDMDISRTVGWFTSIFPAFFNIDSSDVDHNIKNVKEQIRKIPGNGFDYSILKYFTDVLPKRNTPCVRFNFLGDFDSVYKNNEMNISKIICGLDSDVENRLSAMITIDAIITDGGINVKCTYDEEMFDIATVEKLMIGLNESLNKIIDESSDKESQEFTPSDFDISGVSIDDWEALFN